MNWQHNSDLDSIHHVAIEVEDIAASTAWYRSEFHCRVAYQDETWALLEFGNMSLALVTEGQHPPHIAFVSEAAKTKGPLKTHRDGTRSVYASDPSGNAVEFMDPESIAGSSA